jgi:ornithine decarboxylase
MRMQLIDHQTRLQLPASWPNALRPEALNRMDHPTPFLVCDLDTVRERYARLAAALPGVRCFYAVKCNPEPELLSAFDQLGSSFELASCAELQMLQKLGVDPEKLLYSNTVKPAAHIAESFAAGLWRYAFDSEGAGSRPGMSRVSPRSTRSPTPSSRPCTSCSPTGPS